MYKINGPISKKTYFNVVKSNVVADLQTKNKEDGEALFWAYYKLIIEDVDFPADKDWEIIWKKLTRSQKIIFVVGMFISQTNNGGVWQFLFNRPEYSTAAAEAFHDINPMLLWRYEHAYKEFVTMANAGDFWPLKEMFSDEAIPFEDRWKAFKAAGEKMTNATEIDETFYTAEFKKDFYGTVNEFVERNLGKLLEVKSENERPVIKKKDAIPHFSEYLKNAYGVAPEEVAVYYTGRVTIENTPTNLFLMKFKMPDGYESMGITGYFTHHLPDLPFTEVRSMHQRHHKQTLVNLFHGWYLVDKALAKNPKANQVDKKKWEKFVAKIQSPEKTQIPVNIEFKEYMKIGKDAWYIYTGDLLYNDPKNPLDDYTIVDGVGLGKDAGLRGEPNLMFFTKGARSDFGGRASREAPVEGKYRLYALVGGANKLLKDNPWGF